MRKLNNFEIKVISFIKHFGHKLVRDREKVEKVKKERTKKNDRFIAAEPKPLFLLQNLGSDLIRPVMEAAKKIFF